MFGRCAIRCQKKAFSFNAVAIIGMCPVPPVSPGELRRASRRDSLPADFNSYIGPATGASWGRWGAASLRAAAETEG